MVITVSKALTLLLQQFIPVTNGNVLVVINTVSLDSVLVFPSAPQTVPDWVSYNPLFLLAVAAGNATVVTGPTNAASLTASESSSNIALPATGTSVVITNTSEDSPIFVALGTSDAVTVTPQTGVFIIPGSTIELPLGENTYLAAISGEPSTLVNICVLSS